MKHESRPVAISSRCDISREGDVNRTVIMAAHLLMRSNFVVSNIAARAILFDRLRLFRDGQRKTEQRRWV